MRLDFESIRSWGEEWEIATEPNRTRLELGRMMDEMQTELRANTAEYQVSCSKTSLRQRHTVFAFLKEVWVFLTITDIRQFYRATTYQGR